MDESDERVVTPDTNNHPWGGTVIETEVNQEIYQRAVSERFLWDVLDFSNAIALHILNGFAERVSEATDWLTNQTEDSSFITNSEAVSKFFLVHTLSSSIFEATSYLLFTEPLCYVESKTGSSIVDYFDHDGERNWYKVEDASNQEEKRVETIKRIQDAFKANQYLNTLTDFIQINSELISQIDELYGQRGSLVHSIINITGTTWDDVKATAELWETCILEFLQIAENKLAVHQGLYQGLQN